MGFYVHLHVCFECHRNEGVAAVASKHLASVKHKEARWFLEDLSTRSGPNPGPKGGLSLWGIVGNYTSGDEFVSALMPFWQELLSGQIDDGPLMVHRIVVFVQPEEIATTAYEIFREDPRDPVPKVQVHELNFGFKPYDLETTARVRSAGKAKS